MAALTQNLFPISDRYSEKGNAKMAAGTTFYDHAFLMKSGATDTVTPLVKGAGRVFAGVKDRYLKTDAGEVKDDGILTDVEMECNASGLSANSYLKDAYADDDNLIYDADQGNRVIVGKITKVISANKCRVRIKRPG